MSICKAAVKNTLFCSPRVEQVCQAAEGRRLIHLTKLREVAGSCPKCDSVLKSRQRDLLKVWSDASGTCLNNYSKKIVQPAAQQLGVQFGDAIRAAAGQDNGMYFTNICHF
jgi:hypothetical protein